MILSSTLPVKDIIKKHFPRLGEDNTYQHTPMQPRMILTSSLASEDNNAVTSTVPFQEILNQHSVTQEEYLPSPHSDTPYPLSYFTPYLLVVMPHPT